MFSDQEKGECDIVQRLAAACVSTSTTALVPCRLLTLKFKRNPYHSRPIRFVRPMLQSKYLVFTFWNSEVPKGFINNIFRRMRDLGIVLWYATHCLPLVRLSVVGG